VAGVCVSAELANAEELGLDVKFLGGCLGEALDYVFALGVAGREGADGVGTEGGFGDD